MVLCREEVDEKWDQKVRGLLVDSSLAGCGDYVDFVPRNLPHIVCPPFVKQHRIVIWMIADRPFPSDAAAGMSAS